MSQMTKLDLHVADQIIDVFIHVVNQLNISLIFCCNSILKLSYKAVLIFNYFLAVVHLLCNIFCEFLTILFFFQFLPVPIDFNVFLMTNQNFIFKFRSSFRALLFFHKASLVLLMTSFESYFVNHLICLSAQLFKDSTCFINFNIAKPWWKRFRLISGLLTHLN